MDRDYFSKFIQQSVQGAYYLLTKETTAEEEPETEKNKRVVIQVQYLDAVRGGPYKVQVKGALINDHLVPLRAGSEFQGYCAQLGLGPDRELTWVSDPLSLSM